MFAINKSLNIDYGLMVSDRLGYTMLYLIFVNDVSSFLKHCSLKLYADDTDGRITIRHTKACGKQT